MATYEKILKTVVITTKSGGEFTIADTATTSDGSAVWEMVRGGANILYKDGDDWQFIRNDCICSAKATVTTAEVEKPEDEFCQPIEDPCAEEPTP